MLTQLFVDDFSGYANQAAFEAAYPYDPPTNNTTSSTGDVLWGLTNGPGGGPGVQDLSFSVGFFDKFSLSPEGYLFRIAGTWDCDFTPSFGNAVGELISQWWAPAGDRNSAFAGHIVQLSRTHATGSLTITVQTTPAFANGVNGKYFQILTGVLPSATIVDVRVDGKRSTIVETSPGVFEPVADGYVRVYLDDVEVFSFVDAPVWHGRDDINGAPYWNGVTFGAVGRLGNIEIWHDPTGTVPPVDVPPMQRASYVLFSNDITERQIETRLTRSFVQILVADPPAAVAPDILPLVELVGTVVDSEGNQVSSGQLIFKPRSFITTSGYLITPNEVRYTITGPISVNIAPSNGVLYDVEFDPTPADTTKAINRKSGYWKRRMNIPTVGPVDIADL